MLLKNSDALGIREYVVFTTIKFLNYKVMYVFNLINNTIIIIININKYIEYQLF